MRIWIAIFEVIALAICIWLGVLWILNPGGSYEPQIVVAGLVFTATEVYRRYQRRIEEKQPHESDVRLLAELRQLFSEPDLMRIYKEHGFLSTFEKRHFAPLAKFVETWDNTEHEFVDPKLEKAKKNLYKCASALAIKIAQNTIPTDDGNWITVKPRHLPMGPTPKWVIEDAEEINLLVPPFVKSYEQFIRLARKRL